MSQLFTHDKNSTIALPRLKVPAFNGAVMAMLAMAVAGLGLFIHFATQTQLGPVSTSEPAFSVHGRVVNPSVLNLRNAEGARQHRAAH